MNMLLGQGGTRIIVTLRDNGVNIPKNKREYCIKHGNKNFDKIEQPALTELYYTRVNFSEKDRERIKDIFKNIDNFDGSYDEKLEIDHRIPVQRLKELEDKEELKISELSDKDIKDKYQLLSRKNNLIKSRACENCILRNKKPEKNKFNKY